MNALSCLEEDNDGVSNFPEMYIQSFSEFSGFIRCKTTSD